MAKNLALQRPKVAESHSRSPKDLYREFNFNQSAGMIRPVLSQFMPKGTKGIINRRCFTRTAQVVSPAFDRITQHVDFFKVPLRLLYSAFNDWSLNINDVNSSLLMGHVQGNALALPVNLPSADFSGILDKIFDVNIMPQGITPSELANYYNEALRLIDSLDYGSECDQSQGANVMSLLKLAAYQKVYYDHYRNTSYTSNNAYHYNLDWMMDSPIADLTDQTTLTRLRGLFQLRYVNYRNDYFHNVYPHLNYVTSSPTGIDWVLPSGIGGAAENSYNSGVTSGNSVDSRPFITMINNQGTQLDSFTNVQAIRAAFALDKIYRASSYAPKHVKDQIKARFGVDVSDKVSFESERIGSYVNNVVFGEVTSTATTGSGGSTSSVLGQIGGKGVGSSGNDKDLKFYCDEDSLILGVCYFMPKGFYDSTGVDQFNNWETREAFPQPEYMNLGLRPVYYHHLFNGGTSTERNRILGFTVPYASTKLSPDKNYGLFSNRFHYYTAGAQGSQPQSAIQVGLLSTFATHVENMSRSTLQGNLPFSADSFKVSPSDLDSIFKSSYPATGSPINDQFFGWMAIKCSVVNWLSVHGQPSL